MTKPIIERASNQKEKILDLGLEGGGLTVYRKRVGGSKRAALWVFWRESIGMYLDRNDDEMWRESRSEPVSSFDEIIDSLGNEWPIFHPIFIHPDYRGLLKAALDRSVPLLPDYFLEHWHRLNYSGWLHALGQAENED